MIAVELPPPPVVAPVAADELFALQLRLARRADELAGGHESNRGRDLLLWFQAEHEILPAWGSPERELRDAG